MPANPLSSDLYVSSLLTDVSIAYIQDHAKFASAHALFPVLPVDKQEGKYALYTKGDWFRDEAKRIVAGSETSDVGFDVDLTNTYDCERWGVHADATEEDYANQDDVFDVDADKAELVTQSLLIREETRWTEKYFVTGLWTGERAGVASGVDGTEFLRHDVDGSIPITDYLTAGLAMEELTGYLPNKLAVNPYANKAHKLNAQITAQLTPTQKEVATAEILAKLFEVEQYVILRAVKNSARKGAADSMAYLHGKHSALFYAAPTPGKRQPSAGYTFAWKNFQGSGPNGQRMKIFPVPHLNIANRIQGEIATDRKLIAADMGYMFLNTVS